MMRFYLRSELSVCISYIYLCTYRGAALDHVIIQPARTSDAVWPLCALLRLLTFHFGRFRSTAAASALLRQLSLHCGCSLHYCGRSILESDCVRSMFRSRVHLWATICT